MEALSWLFLQHTRVDYHSCQLENNTDTPAKKLPRLNRLFLQFSEIKSTILEGIALNLRRILQILSYVIFHQII